MVTRAFTAAVNTQCTKRCAACGVALEPVRHYRVVPPLLRGGAQAPSLTCARAWAFFALRAACTPRLAGRLAPSNTTCSTAQGGRRMRLEPLSKSVGAVHEALC